MNGEVRGGILALLLVAVVALVPFRVLKISGHSMEPTLHDGDTYLMDQFYWKPGGLRRGDIVVLRHGEEKWVKRLVGMPGDQLQFYRQADEWISEVDNLTSNPSLKRREGPVHDRIVGYQQVQPGEIYVIGDNMNHSSDSRSQEAGSFSLTDVIGVVRTLTLRREFAFQQHP